MTITVQNTKIVDPKVDRMISDIVGNLTDPIICHRNNLDRPPENIQTAITIQRLIENMKANKENRQPLGTEAECAWYLSTASLDAPLSSEWVRIYMYVFGKLCETTHSEVPEELRQESLDNYEMGLLLDLKQWIYRKRTEGRLERDRTERREQKEAENQKQAEQPVLQPALFEF